MDPHRQVGGQEERQGRGETVVFKRSVSCLETNTKPGHRKTDRQREGDRLNQINLWSREVRINKRERLELIAAT